MMRGSRVAVTRPKSPFTWFPCASNLTVVLTDENCVVLKTLYASALNCMPARRRNLMFLNSDMFQLLIPGPRATTDGALPKLPAAGRADAAVLNQRSNGRWLLDRLARPSTIGRQPPRPPTRPTPSVKQPQPKPELEV